MKPLLLFTALLLALCGYGQKNDYVWLSGYDSNVKIDSAQFGYEYGNAKMSFNHNPVEVSYDSLSINFDKDNVTVSDSEGNLLFSSNAVYIFNSFNEKIENGDSLNVGYIENEWDPNIQKYGYRYPQGVLSIQDIINSNLFYLIYSYVDTVDGTNVSAAYCPKVQEALIDMAANNARGKVIYKNIPLLQGNFGSELSAIRHGNGRDWWILIQKRNTNCYYRILVDTSDPHVLPNLTCGDSVIFQDDIGSVVFSPDGSKYVYFTVEQGLKIFDFDRCSGELSNPVHISINIWKDSSWLANGLAISSNNRFLYLSATDYLVQYDLQATDIASSADTVGIYDGYYIVVPAAGSFFNTSQIGPDGKIYIGCGNTLPVYHVINNPNAKGVACDFQQHSLHLPTLSHGVPNFPNYRLGALTGSACDTITGLNDLARAEKERILKVFPNPATDIVTVDYGFTDWSSSLRQGSGGQGTGTVSLQIVNELGQTVYNQALPQYSGFQKIDVSRFAAGVYQACIKRAQQVIAVQKFAKE